MAEYEVRFKQSAEKEIAKLPASVATRIWEKIEALAREPRPSGCKKLRDSHDQWRIRVGDYRLLYWIDDAAKIVRIAAIRHRSVAYE